MNKIVKNLIIMLIIMTLITITGTGTTVQSTKENIAVHQIIVNCTGYRTVQSDALQQSENSKNFSSNMTRG